MNINDKSILLWFNYAPSNIVTKTYFTLRIAADPILPRFAGFLDNPLPTFGDMPDFSIFVEAPNQVFH